MSGNKSKQNGITIITLVVTLVVMAILAGILITTLTKDDTGVINKTTDGQIMTELSQLQEKLDKFKTSGEAERLKNGDYSGTMSNEDLANKGITKNVYIKNLNTTLGVINLDKLGVKSKIGNNGKNVSVAQVENLQDENMQDVFAIDINTNIVYYIRENIWSIDGQVNENALKREEEVQYAKPQISVTPETYNGKEAIKAKIIVTKGSKELNENNIYEYYLSSSKTSLTGGQKQIYKSGEDILIGEYRKGDYYLLVKQIKDIERNSSTGGTIVTINSEKYHTFGPYTFDNDSLIEYTITYELAGGKANNPTTFNKNTPTFTLNNPTKIGYRFNGWTGSNGETPQETVTIEQGSRENRNYIANWNANTYTVRYDENGATGGNVGNSTHIYDQEKALNINGYTKTGYTFKNWNTKADGTGITYTNEQKVKNLTANNGEVITLFAQWQINNYNVTYNYSENGGTTVSKTTDRVNYNSAIDLTPTATKSGWTFIGWNTSKDATTKLNSLMMQSSDVILYAIYSKTITATTYYYNGTTNASKTLSQTIYNKTTNANINLGTTSLSGYTFRGWSTNNTANAGITVATNGNASISSNTNYYASYSYTITGTYYYYNGSNYINSTANATAYMNSYGTKIGAKPTAPTVSNPSGWTARGWSTNNGSSASIVTPEVITANTTYYYSWQKTITLSYNTNGGSTAPTNQTGTAYLNYAGATTNANITITATIPTKTGYTFKNWNTNQVGKGTAYNKSASISINANTTLYAQYTVNQYKINYNLNGGTDSGNPTSYSIESEDITLKDPTKTGYKFNGWTESQDGLGTVIAKDTGISFNGTKITMENNREGNVLNNSKLQIWSSTSTYLNQINSGINGKISGDYTNNYDTGNYVLRFGANGTTQDCTIFLPVKLEKGSIYHYEWEIESFTESKIVVNNLKFYKKDGSTTGIPIEIISKGSYGDRNYIASWIETTPPIVTLTPNGGNYTMPTVGNATIKTTLNAADDGSGLDKLEYAWSTSNTIEPTNWTTFTNGQEVSKKDCTAGTYYLWTNVTDKEDNRAVNVKISNAFIVGENTITQNQITLVPNTTAWTNQDVTVTATYGTNLTQNRTLICTGTVNTDYVVNGTSSVVVKTNEKTVTVTAEDIAGNKVVKTLTITNIDKENPTMENNITSNYKIDFSTWNLKGNTYVDNEGKLVLPNNGDSATSEFIPINEKAWIYGMDVYTTQQREGQTNGGAHMTQEYFDKQYKSVVAPNGYAANGWAANAILNQINHYVIDSKAGYGYGKDVEYVRLNIFTGDQYSQAPITYSNMYFISEDGNTNNSKTIKVISNDTLSKVKQTKWLSGTKTIEDFKTSGTVFRNSFEATNNGTYTIHVQDNAGNETTKVITVSGIDRIAPNSFTPTATSTTNSITVSGITQDQGLGIGGYRFSKDNGVTWSNIQTTSTYTFTGLTQNTNYTIKIKALDKVGNITESSSIVVITKNITKPTITLSTTGWTNQDITATITYPSIEGITKQYSYDGSNWITYTGPLTIETNKTIYAKSIDSTNQGSDSTRIATLNVTNMDKINPEAETSIKTKEKHIPQTPTGGDIYKDNNGEYAAIPSGFRVSTQSTERTIKEKCNICNSRSK